ncbi:hypothetical protein N864_13015 [Intrasporangium chromatireducens Q5-1]|uniref:DUF6036 domain-containing protein n=1 Tax=Intrasporangium chromatireducens Q5-1 TaxID=584657 RepID=W9GT69_9MICO|nr:DUF6036 family nucleotidyltransferase [Intrasporangium chromatireducens]EWT07059.1 hypothetical protein N864_13015 [Intrasporangium chromatireducens Q5-1]
MNRDQLAHLLRASTRIAGDPDILVIGSQAILGSFDEDDLPAPATASREVDIAFLNDPGGKKADLVDAAIGELSPFDEQFGCYAQGVEVSTAVLPTGWRDRLVVWQNQSTWPSRAVFLDPHDLALAKLAAFRDKDRAFVTALLDAKLLAADALIDRLADLPVSPQTRDRISGFLGPWRN